MAIYNWSDLDDGDVFGGNLSPFDPFQDQLIFDGALISAADVSFTFVSGVSSTFSYGGKTVTLNAAPETLTTTNVSFADGSLLIVGDNDTLTGADGNANTLTGGTGDDQLVGLGGADSLQGNAGDDVLIGGAGNDTLGGGAGSDAAIFIGASSGHSFTLSGSNVIITDTDTVNGNDGADTLLDIEHASFSDGVVNLGSLHESRVNSTTAGDQGSPSIAKLSNGGHVIVWQSFSQDGSGWGVYGQRYDAVGTAVGGEFQVNTTTADDQRDPTVDALDGGGFVVAWQSPDGGGNGTGVFAQRFDQTGNAAGSEFQVNSFTTGNQTLPRVVGLSGGGFAVVWQYPEVIDGITYHKVVAKVFAAGGTPTTGEFQIVLPSTDFVSSAWATGPTSDGGFVVSRASGEEAGGTAVAKYSANGNPLIVNEGTGDPYTLVNTGTYISVPLVYDVTGRPDGSFVVVSQYGDDSSSMNGSGVVANRFSSNGGLVQTISVNDTIAGAQVGEQVNASVATCADGGFVVTWMSSTEGSGWGIYAKRYDANGNPATGQFLVNTTTVNDQTSQQVAAHADGGYVVTWQSNLQDGSGYGIFAQRYDAASKPISIVLVGNDGDNLLNWTEGGNGVLDGGNGNDTLAGGTGDDSLLGGAGIDIASYVNATAGVALTLADGALNTIYAGTDTLSGIEGFIGSGFNDYLTGNNADNTLDGGAGADTLAGGTGDDTFVIDDAGDVVTENLSQGTDLVQSSISYTLGSDLQMGDELENLMLVGSANLNGTGNGLNNSLTGNDGDNVLDGQAGADAMAGGAGNDTYVVDDAGDSVTEGGSAGTDLVQSSISYTLGADLENLTLTGSANVNGTGNTLANLLTGNSLANTLDGGAGDDTLAGGADSDTYIVDSTLDVIQEIAGGGTADEVRTSVSYTLATGVDIETLTLTGSFAINGTGNELSNSITGNSAANVLDGGAGQDFLNGMAGPDSMIGGMGNDTYAVDEVGDVVTEGVSAGTDWVQSSISYVLGANLENLMLTPTGSANLNVTGNSANNSLSGNFGNNVLDGQGGADTMWGFTGNDTYVVDHGGDVVMESPVAGTTDLVQSSVSYTLAANVENLVLTGSANVNGTGNSLNNSLTGNDGDNVLSGQGGADTLAGGQGNDTYIIDSGFPLIQEVAGGGTADEILMNSTIAGGSFTLPTGVDIEKLTFGVFLTNGTGNELANLITGNGISNALNGAAGDDTLYGGVSNDTLSGGAGNDILDGGANNDSLLGGAGDDTYFIDSEADVVNELADEGTDVVKSPLTTTALAVNVERLVLLGTTALEGFGNSLGNHITGNVLANLLDGGAGADTMEGGKGDDSYQVDNSGDVVIEANSSGNDVIETIVTYGLPNFVENLTLLGTADLNGTGNFLSNILVGNAGDNVLDGGLNDDIMIGGPGNDVYKVDNPNDLIIENPNEGIDRVDASISYDLSANVENLTLENIDNVTLLGNGDHDATGNELANVLTGNMGNNLLDGRGEDDTLVGGQGNDSYIVEQSGDVVTELAGQGTDLVRTTLTSYTLGSDFENLTLEAGAVNGTGNELDNLIIGNDGDNSLVGGDGDDTLDGGPGADTMVGGDGNDRYDVDNAGDLVIELPNQGQDAVFVDFSDGAAWNNTYNFILPTNVEDAFFDFVSLSQITQIVGNALGNLLQGNDGQNILDGGGGDDTLQGGNGDDTYVVGESGDLVLENGSAGVDTVQTSIDYSLAANVENLQLLGTALQGIGNALNNQIVGNAANNVLDDGGAGLDTLSGGAGNDLYVVHSGSVVLDETGGSGHDTVQTYANLQLAGGLEDAILAGFDNLNVQGNSLGNLITSNTGNNLIDGASGVDRVSYSAAVAGVSVNLGNSGGQGQSTGGGGADILIAIEEVLGSNYNDTLVAGTGNNILDGGVGSDTMAGGSGSDTYYVDDTGDVVTEISNTPPGGLVLPGGGSGGFKPGLLHSVFDSITDTVIAAINFSVDSLERQYIENITLTGSATQATGNSLANELLGNELANVLLGLGGNDTVVGLANSDTLDGGSGIDSLAGGVGDDSYFAGVTAAAAASRIVFVPDVIVEVANEGADTIRSNVSFTLSAEVENLVLTGAPSWRAYTGAGNELANHITGEGAARHHLYGNGGDDTLIGGTGVDSFTGGSGADVFVFDSAPGADKILDFASGVDQIHLDNAIFTAFGTPGTVSPQNVQVGLESALTETSGNSGDGEDYLKYATDTGHLYYDADGTGGVASLSLIATAYSSGTTPATLAFSPVQDIVIV